MTRAALTLVLVFGFACGGDDGASSIAGAPDCLPGQLIVQGTFGDTPVSENRTNYSTFTFVNKTGNVNGALNIGFPTLENVYIEFPDFTKEANKLVRARAFLDFEAGGGIVGGFCDETTSYTAQLLVPKPGNQYEFSITQMRDGEPFCSAEIVMADIQGCFMPRSDVDAGI